jgi:hypothetical protein
MRDANIIEQVGEDDETWVTDEALEDTSVTIGLGKTGEMGSGYHVRNDPSQPFQRQTAVEQRGVIEARCRSCEIVHGILSPDADEYATLLVYQVDLDATKRSRRIMSATIEFEFSSSTPGGRAPRVHTLVPEGRVALLPSTQDETVVRGAEAKADASGITVASAGVSVKWEKTVSRTASDEARVTGSTLCDDLGREVGARWLLSENGSLKSGVPSQLRCAMLLARDDAGPFQCNITIKLEADWKSALGRLFGTTPTDDPVYFNPDMEPTNRLRKAGYDTDNLAAVSLDEFVSVRF